MYYWDKQMRDRPGVIWNKDLKGLYVNRAIKWITTWIKTTKPGFISMIAFVEYIYNFYKVGVVK